MCVCVCVLTAERSKGGHQCDQNVTDRNQVVFVQPLNHSLQGPLSSTDRGPSPQGPLSSRDRVRVRALVPPGSSPSNQQEDEDIMRQNELGTDPKGGPSRWALTVGPHGGPPHGPSRRALTTSPPGPLVGLLSPLTQQPRPSRLVTLRHFVLYSPVSCSMWT